MRVPGRGSTESGWGAAARASETGPRPGAPSARRSPSTPSRRACCASCPRRSAAFADGTARSPTARRPRSRPRQWPRCPRASRRNRAAVRHLHGLDVRMDGRSGVGGVEERLAQAVRRARPGEPLVEQHGDVRDRRVEFLTRRMAVLGPLVGMPAAHRRDPLALRHVLPPGRERFLNLADRRGVLEHRVIAGPVGQADDVHVAFDEAGHDGSPFEVHDARVGGTGGRGVADRDEPAVPDRHGPREFRASIVWIRPLVRTSVASGCCARSVRRRSRRWASPDERHALLGALVFFWGKRRKAGPCRTPRACHGTLRRCAAILADSVIPNGRRPPRLLNCDVIRRFHKRLVD